MNRAGRWSRFALEAPLAIASLGVFWMARGLLRRLVNLHVRRHAKDCDVWQRLDGAYVARPGVLPVLLTNAPRWNPHAFIASAGPWEVQRSIEIHTRTARASAGSWFLVVYSFPDRKAVGSVSCLNSSGADWEAFTVPHPGRYLIGARLYQPSAEALFPALRVDGAERVQPRLAPPGMNEFYSGLMARRRAFYYCLSSHVYAMLRYRRLLPRSLVERVFLPVGNPETRFHYGTIQKGECLCFRFNPALLDSYDLYVTIYSRHSLPVVWYRVLDPADSLAPPSPAAGYYLVRVQQRRANAPPLTSVEWDQLVAVHDPPLSPSPA